MLASLPLPYSEWISESTQLPEHLQIDPPSVELGKPRKKRKHKHGNIERVDDMTDIGAPVPKLAKMPSDAYSFIKPESHQTMFTPEHGAAGVGSSATQILSQQSITSTGSCECVCVCVCVCVYIACCV